MMEPAAAPEHEPTLVDLADRYDTEGMVGFTQAFHNDLKHGFEAVNAERYPWLDDLRQAPWSGVLCLGMGGSAAGGDFLAALTANEGGCPVVVHRDYTACVVQRHVVGAGDQSQRQHRRNGRCC